MMQASVHKIFLDINVAGPKQTSHNLIGQKIGTMTHS